MSRADVEGVECSTHGAVADSSYVEETGHVDKRDFEAIGSDNEDDYSETPALARTCSEQMSMYSRVRPLRNEVQVFNPRARKFVVVFTLA